MTQRGFHHRNAVVNTQTGAHAHALSTKDTDSAAVWKPEASISDSSASLPPDRSWCLFLHCLLAADLKDGELDQ